MFLNLCVMLAHTSIYVNIFDAFNRILLIAIFTLCVHSYVFTLDLSEIEFIDLCFTAACDKVFL